jgi:hypothetical protein
VSRRVHPLLAFGRLGAKGIGIAGVAAALQHVGKSGKRRTA